MVRFSTDAIAHLSFKTPKKYTPMGPPKFKAASPTVGYMSRSQTKLY